MIIDLAKIYRGKNIESIHYGMATLVNSSGLLDSWGDPNFSTYTRSIIKPIQLKVCMDLGLELEGKMLSLGMASHRASEEQRQIVQEILDKFGLKESDLQCGCSSGSRGKLISPIYHNCSGKHSAILATSKINSWDLENYLESSHPIQVAIKKELEALLPGINLDTAKDGCGLPSFYMKISEMAMIFANLIKRDDYRKIISGMNAYPSLISSEDIIDAQIMNAEPAKLIAKVGAEGLIMVSNLEKEESLILKVIDGGNRARAQIIVSLMEYLGWLKKDQITFDNDSIKARTDWSHTRRMDL